MFSNNMEELFASSKQEKKKWEQSYNTIPDDEAQCIPLPPSTHGASWKHKLIKLYRKCAAC